MGFNDSITRAVSSALTPEVVTSVWASAIEQSAVLSLVPEAMRMQMPVDDVRIPVFATDVEANWVVGDTGLKQTTAAAWENKHLIAEELAAIVVIPDRVARNTSINLTDFIVPRLGAAIGKAFDLAVLFPADGRPSTFPAAIWTDAVAASQHVSDELGDDLFDAVMGPGGLLALIEEDGFPVSGFIASNAMKARLRGLRTSDGVPLYQPDLMQRSGGGPRQWALDGLPVRFPQNGVFPAGAANAAITDGNPLMIAGDWSQMIVGIRQEIEITIANTGVITDEAGNIIINLFQQDAKALRATFVAGYQVPNPVNQENANSATRYPFSVLYDGA